MIPKYTGPETRHRTDKMSRDEIKARFDNETASAYSQRTPVWLPDFEHMFGLVPRILRPHLPPGSRVLDLGAGTGNLSRTVLEHIPDISCTLMDFSPNMLAEVPNVLEPFSGRFETIEADFARADLGRNRYDAVISSFAIHHMRSLDEYRTLYRAIAASLSSVGIFLCCDVVAGARASLSAIDEEDWIDFLQEKDFAQADIERILSNYRIEDSPISVHAHMNLIEEAGFETADIVWKRANFAVYVGLKSGQENYTS
jgi:tRNA (cmo5U34)-methyltransferase